MKKLFLFTFCLLFAAEIKADFGFETWWDYNVITDLGKHAQARIEQEYEFARGSDHLLYHYSENILFFKLKKWLFTGPFVRLARAKEDSKWLNVVQPGIIIRNWFKALGVDWYTRLKVFRNIVEELPNATVARLTLGLELCRTRKFSVYLADEVFYNSIRTHEIDVNYTYIGIHTKLDRWFSYDMYYNLYEFKPGPKKAWRMANVIAFAWNVHF